MWPYAIMVGYYLINLLGIEILGAAGATSTGYLGWGGLGGLAKSESSTSCHSCNAGSMQASSPDGKIRLTKVQSNLSNQATAFGNLSWEERRTFLWKIWRKHTKGRNWPSAAPKIFEWCWMQSQSWFQAPEEKARRWRAWAFCSASSWCQRLTP